jgi:sec-independent protein translocase protein TatC
VLFGYFGIVPLSLQFLGNYELADVESKITIMSYMKTVATITLASGLVFQLPIVIYFLSKVGLVTPATLRSYRKHALVVNLVLAAIITPPDITSQVMVAIPVLFLYEISIYISARVEKGRLQKQSTPAR